MTPVDVSLWISVSASNWPVASFSSMSAARIGEPHVDLQAFGVFAAALRDIQPFVRERAAHAVEDFFRDEIANGAFHHAPGRRGAR